jgi:acyl-CoA dehydrogenase
MIFGDAGGATGFLIGEENAGMNCMFTMMNRARLAVGLQGVGIAECATQKALSYARERRQGRTAAMDPSQSAPIIAHPDVRRMLLTMRALTQAARAVCYATALAIDRSERGSDKKMRRQSHAYASLLTPVAKAFSTDIANDVASLGIQVHGGAGYIEETGAAQLFRDARIAAIYEGTNGIQAIDLVTRKLPLDDGAIVNAHLNELRGIVRTLDASNDPGFGWAAVRLGEAVDSLARTTAWLMGQLSKQPEAALAGAAPYLRLFGLASGGCLLAKQALSVKRLGEDAAAALATARFFAEHVAVTAGSLERSVVEGAAGVIDADAALTVA